MAAYHNETSLSPATSFQPICELKVSRNGALLMASKPRYNTFDEYVQQMAAPISSLPGAGWLSFADPLMPELMILVQGERVPWCSICDRSLDHCQCPF
jgi:hypothetical protein